MSRRNLLVIAVTIVFCLVCIVRADRSPYGRYLSQVLDAIDRWALQRVPPQQIFDGAMRGIVDQLDDHSSYISSRDLELFEADLEQEFGGIGVVLQQKGENRQLTVVSPPLFGTPALDAGIRVHDRILEIDGVSTVGMTMEEVVRRMRGKQGEPIELTLLHRGEDQPVRKRIVRDTIRIPSVLGDFRRPDGSWDYRLARNPRVGYLRIINFGERTSEELRSALETLRARSVAALVLDLRDNAGGLLPAAVETCDLFLPEGRVIVSIRGRHPGMEDVRESTGRGGFLDLPIVVLVNRYTASASEIVAACLQDHQRAVVAGERTWGKGTVQHVIPIESGRSILKLTAATYWRPSGKNIHRLNDDDSGQWGVQPDPGMALPLSEEQRMAIRERRNLRDTWFGPRNDLPPLGDPQLDLVLEYLSPRLESDASPARAR